MEIAAYTIIACGFVYLGARIFRKFKEIASWKSDEEITREFSSHSAPNNLHELKIDEPDSFPDSDEHQPNNS